MSSILIFTNLLWIGVKTLSSIRADFLKTFSQFSVSFASFKQFQILRSYRLCFADDFLQLYWR